MDDTNRLDLVFRISAKPVFNLLWVNTAAPIGGQKFGFKPQAGRHFMPKRGEMPRFNHQHQITLLQGIHQSRFPCART